MKYINLNKFLNQIVLVVISILVAIIILQRTGCGEGSGSVVPPPDTVRVVDTTYVEKTKVIYKKIPITIEQPADTVFLPEPMYEPLKEQYLELANDFGKRRIYKDTLVLDSIGHVYVTDSVRYNKLEGRSYLYSYKLPIVAEKTTINNHAAPKRQLYIGGGISATKTSIASLQTGFLYKDRKDRVFGAYAGLTPAGQLSIGVQSYWKIKLN